MKKFITSIPLLLFIFISVSGQDSTQTHFGNIKRSGQYLEVRGLKMYYEIYGSGKPLLFIHGSGGSVENWENQIPYFAEKYKVIIADSRSQGRSADSGDSLSYEMMADDYAALLDALKIDSAYVVGWSDGGINGLLMAIRHPQKVSKLAITGANCWPDTTAVFPEVINMVKPTYSFMKIKKNKTEREKVLSKLFRLLIEEPHISLTSLNKISCPTLVIGGDHDVIKEEHTMLIYKNIPKAYLWILPNSGHSTPIVYKEAFNKNVDDFLAKPYRVIQKGDRFN